MGSTLRGAIRAIVRNPGFSSVAVITLALGLGANAAIFAVVDRVLLNPLPFPEADRLVVIKHPVPSLEEGAEWNVSSAGWRHFQREIPEFAALGAYISPFPATTSAEGTPSTRQAVRASAEIFAALGVGAAFGRTFDHEEDLNRPEVVVLGHGVWTREFGSDPGVVGRSIEIEGIPFEVIGVMEEAARLPDGPIDLWLPMGMAERPRPVNSHYLNVVGRLGPDVDIETAEARVQAEVDRFTELYPGAYSSDFMSGYGFRARVGDLRTEVVGSVSRSLWLVMGAVGLVLLLACLNVANLFLVRTEDRGREVAVRRALGARPGDLARAFLAESLLLSLTAGLVGLLVAAVGLRGLLAMAPSVLPDVGPVEIGGATVAFVLILSAVTGLVFGSFPSLRFRGGIDPARLKEGGRGTQGVGRARRVWSGLVVGQLALGLVVLVGAALLFRTFQELRSVDPGFTPERAVAVDILLPTTRYVGTDRWDRAWDPILTEVAALPEVEAVGLTSRLPLRDAGACFSIFPERWRDGVGSGVEFPACPPIQFVTAGYFEAKGIPILEGREFTLRDDRERTGPAVISATLAEAIWPGVEPLGQGVLVYRGHSPPYHQVVGIAGDVRVEELTRSATPVAYFPLRSHEGQSWVDETARMTMVVRTRSGDALALLPTLRATVSRIVPDAALANATSISAVVDRSMARTTFTFVLLGIAALVALLLGAVGTYAVLSSLVTRRRSEVGVRMALGARSGQVGGMILLQSLRLCTVGVVVGLALSLALSEVLESLLFGVSSTDALVLGGVSLFLLAVAAASAGIPALRAARVDPARTLRNE